MAKHCTDMYKHLETINSSQLVKSGEKLVSQYMALEGEAVHLDPEDSSTWRATPKFHLFGRILDEARKAHHSKDSWAYRDETLGYDFQKLFFKRGGQPKTGHQAEKVLQEEKFFGLKQALA